MTYRRLKVTVPGLVPPMWALVSLEGGKILPHFNRDQLVPYLRRQTDSVFLPDRDAVVVYRGGSGPEIYPGHDIVVRRRVTHVYGIGAGRWPWQVVE